MEQITKSKLDTPALRPESCSRCIASTELPDLSGCQSVRVCGTFEWLRSVGLVIRQPGFLLFWLVWFLAAILLGVLVWGSNEGTKGRMGLWADSLVFVKRDHGSCDLLTC